MMGVLDPNGIYRMEVEDRVSKKYIDEIARMKAELAQMRERIARLEKAAQEHAYWCQECSDALKPEGEK